MLLGDRWFASVWEEVEVRLKQAGPLDPRNFSMRERLCASKAGGDEPDGVLGTTERDLGCRFGVRRTDMKPLCRNRGPPIYFLNDL